MPRAKWSEEQIIGILKQVEAGRTVVEVCREHGVGESTFYKWKSKYGGLEVNEARRLKSLEDENSRLKRLLADSMLANAALKDALSDIVLLEGRQEAMTLPGARLYVAW